MKLLHIVPSYKPAYIYGGPVESIARLCEGLVQHGEEVTVYTTTANGRAELDVQPGKAYDVDGVKVFYFKRQTKDPLHFSYTLLKRLYKDCRGFDAVHIHSWWNIPTMLGAAICKMRKVRTVFSPRGMLSDYILNNSNSKLKQWAHTTGGLSLLKYMVLHATSSAELEECQRIIPGWKAKLVSNLIWLPELHRQSTGNEVFTLLFLSRIHPKKGIELLMDAVAMMNRDVRLIIAGSGEEQYMHALKKKAAALGIAGRIEWPGWLNRSEKFKALMEADLFVLTSYNENFANVVIEALHAGTPVLLSEGVGLRKFVEENDLGWITKPEPAAIKKNLENAIADAEKRARISAAAPCIVQKHFSPDTLIPQYQYLYAAFAE